MDYPELYKQLNQAIINADGDIGKDTEAFVQTFLTSLPEDKSQLGDEAKAQLTAYLTAMQETVASAITLSTAIGVTGSLKKAQSAFQDKRVLALSEQAFNERWADDLTLSKRLWNWQSLTQEGVGQMLQQGVKTGESVNKLMYNMQRMLEFDQQKRFVNISNNRNKWTEELSNAAKQLIHDPAATQQWQYTLNKVEKYIDKLATTGTRHASLQLLNEMKRAVEKGRLDLVDKSLNWWLYDKQLYSLKRIARTEMATAGHRAVIDASIDDPLIIGYQWRLSSSHKIFDICDYYANIDQGLGKGVFRKDSVPRHKAHPHCLLGDTLITNHGAIVAATKSFYQGRVIEIITRNSRRLTCTPNHSILTSNGWIEAQFLNKGKQIVTTTNSDSRPLNPDDNNVPTTIKQIFDSLFKSSSVSSVTMPISAEDFHGDGVAMDGNVHIVYVNSFLLDKGDSRIGKHGTKFSFQRGNLTSQLLLARSISSALLNCFGFPAYSGLSISRNSLSIFFGCSTHVDRLAFLKSPDSDIALLENSIDNDSGDTLTGGDAFDRFTSDIPTDKVVNIIENNFSSMGSVVCFNEIVDSFFVDSHTVSNAVNSFPSVVTFDDITSIREYDFSGHVYDLQIEPQHWYMANGIVTHNCMCHLIPRVTTVKEAGSANYAEFLETLSDKQRTQVLPKWVNGALDDGIPLKQLLREDGLGLVSMQEAKQPIFSAWVNRVINKDYKAKHEFRQVGKLPDFVMLDSRVSALNPQSNVIHISDHQLRHSLRDVKNKLNKALSVDAISNLPVKLENARWFFDSKHNNLLAVFDAGENIGKSVITINFKKKKELYNVVVTSGVISERTLGMDIYSEIKRTP